MLIDVNWTYVVVDEGHRLKNRKCRLAKELKKVKSQNRLLLTGTPIHNDMEELWSLLNYLQPELFDHHELFSVLFIYFYIFFTWMLRSTIEGFSYEWLQRL